MLQDRHWLCGGACNGDTRRAADRLARTAVWIWQYTGGTSNFGSLVSPLFRRDFISSQNGFRLMILGPGYGLAHRLRYYEIITQHSYTLAEYETN